MLACRDDSALTANIESSRSTDRLAQDGHAAGGDDFIISISNRWPQAEHLYSYKGMYCFSLYIWTTVRYRSLGLFEKSMVLLDIDMPGHDGLWFAERVRAEWPSAAIVFASGVDKMETIERARWLGAVDYVQKPFQWELLAQAMRRAGRAAASASR